LVLVSFSYFLCNTKRIPDILLTKPYVFFHFLLILIVSYFSGRAQDLFPPYVSIHPSGYKSVNSEIGPQNFEIFQEQTGQMLFCNSDCILGFDGHFWKEIKNTSKKGLRCFAKGADNRIYVGGNQQIGYLESNENGETNFISLLDKLPVLERKFGIIWECALVSNFIVFRTSQKAILFNTSNQSFSVFNLKSSIKEFIIAEKQLVIREENGNSWLMEASGKINNLGVFQTKYSILKEFTSSQSGNLSFAYLVEKPKNEYAIIKKNLQEISIDPSIGRDICSHLPRKIVESQNGELAVPTMDGGLYIFNPNGSLRFRINKSNILSDNGVNSIYLDKDNGLWITCDLGIRRIEMDSPLSFLPGNNGLDGVVTDLALFDGYFYVGTSSQVYASPYGKENLQFTAFKNEIGQAFQFLVCDKELLVATWKGVFSLNKNYATKILNYSTTTLAWDKENSTLYITVNEGIFKLKKQGKSWGKAEKVCNLKFLAQFSILDKKGRLWVSDYAGNVAYINTFDPIPAWVSYFNATNGLYMGWNKPFLFKDNVIWTNPKSILSFKEDESKFYPSKAFRLKDTSSLKSFYILKTSPIGETWISDQGKFAKLRKDKDGYEFFDFSPSAKLPNSDSWAFLLEKNHLWFSTNEGLIHYDFQNPPIHTNKPSVLISGITLDGPKDINLFEGTVSSQSKLFNIEIPQSPNLLKIKIASPNYNTLGANLFSYKMVGLQSEWTSWATDNTLKFHALPNGIYTLSIKTINQNGQESDPLNLTIAIKNTWYKSKKTWGGIVTLLLSSLLLFVQLRNNKLRKQNLKLENQIQHQTSQIVELKYQIDHKQQEGKESDE
jgi:hypothetical protein